MDVRVAKLLRVEQHPQLSDSWFTARKTCITASSASSLLIRDRKTCEGYVLSYGLEDIFDYNNKCCNPYSTKNQYFLDKCRGSTFKGNVATYHGQKYESVVTDLYKNDTGKKVLEFGLIRHPELSWLAASPDGITEDGIMIEIKCPYKRKITGVTPIYYFFQVQLQLETCDLDFCDFLEYEFVEFNTEEEWLDNDTLDKTFSNVGLMIQIEKKPEDHKMLANPAENKYIYPPHDILDNVDLLLEWRSKQIQDLKESTKPEYIDLIDIKVCYWKVGEKCNTRIERNKEWFANVKPVFEKEWNLIKYYKKADNYKKLLKENYTVEGKHLHLDLDIDTDFVEDLELCMLSESEEDVSEAEN